MARRSVCMKNAVCVCLVVVFVLCDFLVTSRESNFDGYRSIFFPVSLVLNLLTDLLFKAAENVA